MDLEAINQIAHDSDPMRLLVNSVCPAIWGQEMVKLALCLAVFGGTPDSLEGVDDKNKLAIRSDLHVLVVGEPGLGKSQMLQAISGLAPRGVYVCGNTTSTAGLTVTVVKDAGELALCHVHILQFFGGCLLTLARSVGRLCIGGGCAGSRGPGGMLHRRV